MAESAQEQIQREALKKVGVEGTSLPALTIADRLRDRVKQDGAREALTYMSGTVGITDPERDKTVSILNPTDAAAALTSLNNHNEFIHEGYDALPPAEQDNRRDDVVKALLRSPLMGDVVRGMSGDPLAVEDLTKGILQDKQYQIVFNEGLQKIAAREHKPSPGDIDARKAQLRARGEPHSTADARASLTADFQAITKRDIDNLTGSSVHALLRKNISTAEDVVIKNSKAMESEVGKGIMTYLESQWKDPAAYKKDGTIRRNWDGFIRNGVDGVIINPDQKKYLAEHPEVKKQLEAQIGESLLLKKMRTGKIDKADMVTLVDSEWLGPNQGARVDKIKSIFEAHQGFKDILADAQAKGYVDKNIWDKIKDAGPGAAAGGMLAMLLMLFGLPSLAIAGGALKLGIGAAAGGGAIYGANRLRDAA